MKVLSIDIETYSDIDLGKMGVYKYVDSPNFKIILFAYSVDGAPVKIIDLKNGEKLPSDILACLEDETTLKTAFNAQFERVCINKFFGLTSKNWECTMVKAWSCGINGGLASVGAAIGLNDDEGKMKEGKQLIKLFCLPNKKAQLSLTGEEDWEKFKEYCKRDVEVELKIKERLDKFYTPDWEWDLYTLDQKINDAGIKLDLDMVDSAIHIDDMILEEATKRYQDLTGLDNPNSLKDIKHFIKEKSGKEVKSITKGNLKDLIKEFVSFPEIKEVLEIRALLSKTSTAKYRMMKEVALSDGRSRGNIQHYGASRTGRWAGRLIQVHNLPRNYLRDLDTARKIIKSGDHEMLGMAYNNPPDILSQCLRTAIIPHDFCKFIVSDFSAIEARVIAWFAGEDWVLDVFRGDGKIYEATAARMFNVPLESIDKGSDMRQRGKVATLALGYQGSTGALVAMGALKMRISENELGDIVSKWREANKNIVNFWYETEKAVKKAIKDFTSVTFAGGKLRAFYSAGILFITLPSGRRLAYAKPELRPHDKFDFGDMIVFHERNSAGTSWIEQKTYGGKLVENIVQATARDILGFSMLALDKANYNIVMHVHDEVVIEIDEKRDDLDKVTDLMGREMDWAKGLPLRADGYECSYYMKD